MRRSAALLVVAASLLALPAGAQAAAPDLSITQTPSAKLVKPGGSVNFDVTVTNVGSVAVDQVYVNLYSLRGHGTAAANPYTSANASQGSCADNSGPAYGMYYYGQVCSLGALAPGQSAKIAAVVQVNQSMNHFATLLPNAFEGGYQDANNANNEGADSIFLDVPPKVTGSKMLKFKGLPASCVSGDFTLDVTAKATGVKKIKVQASLGFDVNGDGQYFSKTASGKHLKVKFPASKAAVDIEKTYTLKVKAKLGGGHALKTTVEYARC